MIQMVSHLRPARSIIWRALAITTASKLFDAVVIGILYREMQTILLSLQSVSIQFQLLSGHRIQPLY